MATAPGNFDSLDQLGPASPAGSSGASDAGAAVPLVARATDFSFNPAGAVGVNQEGYYLNADDLLTITAWNSNPALTSITLQLRILQLDGTLNIGQVTLPNLTADRTANSASFQLPPGMLVGAVLGRPPVVVHRGQCFVALSVVRGAVGAPQFSQQLISDYLTSGFLAAWPFGRVLSSVDGQGAIVSYKGSAPAAGFGAQLVQPAATRWRLQSVAVTLATSAAVGNRTVGLQVLQDGNTVMQVYAATPQTPGTTITYTWAPGLPFDANGPQQQNAPLPSDFYVSDGATISTPAAGMAAADQFQGIIVSVEEWIDA
jgi:hypothetical protein